MVDRNNPSDDQWWALIHQVAPDPELCLGQYSQKGAQARVLEKWAKIAQNLNLMKQGNHGCIKTAEGWRTSWNGLKARARKAATDPNRRKHNPLFVKVVELVGPGASPETSSKQPELGAVQQGGGQPVDACVPFVEYPVVEQDLLWADLANQPTAPEGPVCVKVDLDMGAAIMPTDSAPIIILEDTPTKTPVALVKREKQLHTPPSGSGTIPKRRLKYVEAAGDKTEVEPQPEMPGAQGMTNENLLLAKAIAENTATMLKLIKKLDNVSLLPL